MSSLRRSLSSLMHPSSALSPAPPATHHAVQFYDEVGPLSQRVCDYFREGLARGEPGLIIATPRLRELVLAELRSHVDVDALLAQGRLALLDARATLGQLLVDGLPDRRLFREGVGGRVAALLALPGATQLRAYGEMVDLLWRERNPRAALALEHLWSELCAEQPICLLFAYALDHFRNHPSQALATESSSQLEDLGVRLKEVTFFQQRARALESELAQRKDVEAQLREALDARDDFVRVAGHELRTPLTALQLQLQRLLSKTGPEELERRPRVEKALRQAARLSAVLNGLLDVPQLTAGQLALQPERVDLAELMREAALALGGPFQLDVPERLVGLWDAQRLFQVVANLFNHARKHGRGRPIDVTLVHQGSGARFTVRDHGPGLSAENHARIFDRFEGAASLRHFGGLGVGLWVARHIIEAHGGSVHVESQLGQGSTFTVALPDACPDA